MSKKLELNLDDEPSVDNDESQLAENLALEANFDEPLVFVDESQAGKSQTTAQPIISAGFQKPLNDTVIKPIVTGDNHAAIKGKGQLIAKRMLEQGYHPVIFVGSSRTGKTAVLSSLIALLKTIPGAGVSLGQPLIDVTDGYGEEVYRSAKTYFNHAVQAVIDGTAQQATTQRYPFFIPLEVSPLGKSVQRFAFLEINGEWYQAKEDSVDYFPEFQEEIEAVMRHYDKPITVLYTAPLTQNDVRSSQQSSQVENDARMRTANLAIVGGLTRYNEVRTHKGNDNHIFVLTKWDALQTDKHFVNDEIHIENAFEAVSRRDEHMFNLADKIAQKHYGQSYAAFLNLPVPPEQRHLLPYSSGLMTGFEIIKSAEAQPHLDEYRKTLWNLLSAANQQDSSAVIFPKPVSPKVSIWQQMAATARKIFG